MSARWLLVCLLAAWLQAEQPSGQIRGMVIDPNGAFVQGATITLTGKTKRAVNSGADGIFSLQDLPAGRYVIEVKHPNFNDRRSEMTLTFGQQIDVPISLEMAATREVMTVNEKLSEVSLDRQSNANSVVVTATELQRMPALDNDVLAPLLEFLDAGSFGSGGASIVVNGIEVDRKSVPASLIKEVRINQDPYAAEFARPGRGRVEIRTTTATKRIRGSFQSLYRHSALDARNAFAVTKPREHRRGFEGRLTGPLSRSGRDGFVLTFEDSQEDVQTLVLAQTPDGEIRRNIATPQSETSFSAAWQRTHENARTWNVRYEFEREGEQNQSVGGFRLPDVGSTYTGASHQVSFNASDLIRGTVLSELSLRLERESESVVSVFPDAQRIVVDGAFTAGSAQADKTSNDLDLKLYHAFSWQGGKHLLKAGYQMPRIELERVSDRQNRLGTFVFSGLDAYRAGLPLSYTAQMGDGSLAYWRSEFGMFLQDDIRLRSNLSLGFGVRWDWQNVLGDRNNFAPRLSLAYAPGKDKKTVIRAGAGLFYDRLEGSAIANARMRDGVRLRQILIPNPTYPDPFSGLSMAQVLPPNLYQFDSTLRFPYLLQYSVSVERSFGLRLTASAGLIHSRGIALFRSRDANAPFAPGIPRPNAEIGVLQLIEASGHMRGSTLEASVRGQLNRLASWRAQYRYGPTFDDTSGIDSLPANSYDRVGEWGRSDYDVRHRLQMMGSFDAWNVLQTGWFLRAQSASPYNLTTGRDDNGDGFVRDRPFGVRRNALEGEGSLTCDVRISKELRFKGEDGPSLRFALDGFNILNQVNYTSFVGNLSSPYFGRPVAARPARHVQVSVSFNF